VARLLIVNADDYGLTDGVSRAIISAHRDGIVTSTSMLALAPRFRATAAWLDDAPDLGLGAHLAIVGEDPPVLSQREIPTLVDRRGHLALSWRKLLPRAAAGRVDSSDVARELNAQLDLLQAAIGDRQLSHVDTHQHLHLWPAIGAVVVRLATERGITAARLTRSSGRSPVSAVVNRLARRFERLATAAGVATPRAFAGFDEGGTMDETRLVSTLATLAKRQAASAEIGVHPGEAGDPELERYHWGYAWDRELAALTSPIVRSAVESHGFTLGTFAALEPVAP
jgi:predicted glycoside hydrolase/deacetylase ChbG (UPF0249 family)